MNYTIINLQYKGKKSFRNEWNKIKLVCMETAGSKIICQITILSINCIILYLYTHIQII